MKSIAYHHNPPISLLQSHSDGEIYPFYLRQDLHSTEIIDVTGDE